MAEKKVVGVPVTEKRQQVEPEHAELSIRRQCELLGLARSSWYFEPVAVSAADLALMARLDRWHTDHPFLGSRKLATLVSSPEEAVNRKRGTRYFVGVLAPRKRAKAGVAPAKAAVVQPPTADDEDADADGEFPSENPSHSRHE